MPDLSGYCLNRNQESRILNALWGALHDDWPRPRDWHPSPGEVAELRLEVVIGLGFVGQEIVRLWLEEHGFPRKMATKGPATKPGWFRRTSVGLGSTPVRSSLATAAETFLRC